MCMCVWGGWGESETETETQLCLANSGLCLNSSELFHSHHPINMPLPTPLSYFTGGDGDGPKY